MGLVERRGLRGSGGPPMGHSILTQVTSNRVDFLAPHEQLYMLIKSHENEGAK